MALAGIQAIKLETKDIATSGNGTSVHQEPCLDFPVLKPGMAQQAVWMAGQLRASLESNVVLERSQEVLNLIYSRFKLLCKHAKIEIPADIERQFLKALVDEILGFGPLEPLLEDDDVTEVMVNGPDLVYVEKSGRVAETNIKFVDDAHVLRIINRIIEPLGRRVDHDWPMVDARLPDGSRVNAIIPPC